MESGHACPICLKEFNPEIEERTPFKFCAESHFLCKGCIRSYIASQASPQVISVSDADQNFRGIKVECSECVQVHCPVCRCSILPASRYRLINTQTFRFSRDRIFDQMISSKSSTEPSMALEERHKVKTQLDKTHGDFVSFMQTSLNLEPMYQNLKKLKEDYERLMSSQEQSVQEFDSKIGQKVKDLNKLKSDVKEQERVLNKLIKQEPLLKAEYKRQEIAERKKQIEATVEKYEQDIISKHEAEIVLLKERHQELLQEISKRNESKIEELDCYKMGLQIKKKEILGQFIQDNSQEARILLARAHGLQTKIKDYETQISKLSKDADYALKCAIEKNGFDPSYISKQQKKYELEAQELRQSIISAAKEEANIEKKRMMEELASTKEKIDLQLREWRSSRKEFKKFLGLKNKIGEQRAEVAYAPLHGDERDVETSFWRILKEYEKLPNPNYKLSEYNHWKTQKGGQFQDKRDVDTFLMRQRMIYGF